MYTLQRYLITLMIVLNISSTMNRSCQEMMFRTFDNRTTLEYCIDDDMLEYTNIQGEEMIIGNASENNCVRDFSIPISQYLQMISQPPREVPRVKDPQVVIRTSLKNPSVVDATEDRYSATIRLNYEEVENYVYIYFKYHNGIEISIEFDGEELTVETKSDFRWFNSIQSDSIIQNFSFITNLQNSDGYIHLKFSLKHLVTSQELIERLKKVPENHDQG